MVSEIGLCRELCKYRSKKSLPQIALHRYWNSNFIVIVVLEKLSFVYVEIKMHVNVLDFFSMKKCLKFSMKTKRF
jgi:hypothetical protein